MKNRRIAVVLAAALVARASLCAFPLAGQGEAFTPDSSAYWGWAKCLAEEALSGSDATDDWEQEINRTPGYPVFAAIGHAVTLRDYRAGWRVVLCLQGLLDVVLVYLTYRLGRHLVSEGVGLGAAVFQAMSPVVIASSCRVLPDSLYAFCLTAALLLIVGHLKTGNLGRLVWGGVVMAVACYVRPVAIVMAALVVVVLLCRPGRWRRAGAFAGVFVACVAPWVVRNAVVADYYGFSSNGGDTLYCFYTPEIAVRTEGIDGNTARERVRDEAARHAAEHHLTVGGAARWRQRQAMERVAEHPWLYARIHLKGSLGFWLPGATDVLELAGATTGDRNTLEVLRQRGLWSAVRHYFGGDWGALAAAAPMVLLLLVKYAGVAACVVVGLRRRPTAAAWLLAAIVVVSMPLTGPFGLPRYRVPVEPILSVAAAFGWGALCSRVARSPRRAAAPAPPG